MQRPHAGVFLFSGPRMSKAFVSERDSDDEDEEEAARLPELPAGTRNYITPAGYARLRDELRELLDVERPKVVEIVSWAASNGDRSENGDYIYGKKRLREIDRRIRFLGKRLDKAEVVDPGAQFGNERVFFGATVAYVQDDGIEREVTIVGIDEVEPERGRISWISPVARALLKSTVGDVVTLPTPGGLRRLEILDVRYPGPQDREAKA